MEVEKFMPIKYNNYKRSTLRLRWLCSRKNPFDLNAVLVDDTCPKTVLTGEQERKLALAKADSKNYDEYS